MRVALLIFQRLLDFFQIRVVCFDDRFAAEDGDAEFDLRLVSVYFGDRAGLSLEGTALDLDHVSDFEVHFDLRLDLGSALFDLFKDLFRLAGRERDRVVA